MTIEDGKIIKATDDELFKHWLENWSDFYSYTEYKYRMIKKGVEIVDNK